MNLYWILNRFPARIASIAILSACVESNGQGTLYLSNIGPAQPAYPTLITSTWWAAEGFITGGNPQGYTLTSVDLDMGTATGSPNGFAVSIYSAANGIPSQSIAVLTGSDTPTASGVYAYTATGLDLVADTEYYIVASGSSPVMEGSFGWDSGVSLTGSTDWQDGGTYGSTDAGTGWSGFRFDLQTAIYATVVPEPSEWIMLLAGGGAVFCLTRRGLPVKTAD